MKMYKIIIISIFIIFVIVSYVFANENTYGSNMLSEYENNILNYDYDNDYNYYININNKNIVINEPKNKFVLYDNNEYDRNITSILLDDISLEQISELKENLKYFKKLNKIDLVDLTNKKNKKNIWNEPLSQLQNAYPNINIVWTLYIGKYTLKTDDVSFWPKNAYGRIQNDELIPIKYAKKLEAIDLGHHDIEDLNLFSDLINLKILILVDNKITDISPIKKLKNLLYLELYVLNKPNVDLTPLEELKELRDLDLLFYGKIDNVDFLLKYPHLRRMYLVHTNISEINKNKIKDAYPTIEFVCTKDGNADTNGWRSVQRYKDQREVLNTNMMTEKFLNYD